MLTQTRDALETPLGDHSKQYMSEDTFSRRAHGRPAPVPIEVLLHDDPDVWLAVADMRAWSEAHPCECEALVRVRPRCLAALDFPRSEWFGNN